INTSFLRGKTIKSVCWNHKSEVLYAGGFDGLYSIDMTGKTRESKTLLNEKNVNTVWIPADTEGTIWAGCDDGLYVFSDAEKTWRKQDLTFDSLKINTVCGSSDAMVIFLATGKGLFSSYDGGEHYFLTDKTLSNDSCMDIFMREPYVVSLFSNGSVYWKKINELKWNRLIAVDYPAWSIFLDADGLLYLGSNGYGLARISLIDQQVTQDIPGI
ncbi:hypothetical protein JW979_01355, partial [bacterium]|nr:hypothetical protein [candidate division CSSED10-310 bacterium]